VYLAGKDVNLVGSQAPEFCVASSHDYAPLETRQQHLQSFMEIPLVIDVFA
jgi:hypothetical protein